jgi:hypothetical protein
LSPRYSESCFILASISLMYPDLRFSFKKLEMYVIGHRIFKKNAF